MVEPNPSVLRLGLFVRGAERTSQLSRKMSSHPGLRVSVTADSLSEVKAALTAGRMDVSVCGTEFMEIAARFHSRAEPDEPRITRLFLVAHPTVGSVVQGVHTGFDNYLTEDDSVEVWHDTIRRTVDGSASLRADPLWEKIGEPIDMTSLRFDERPEMERNIIELLAEGLTNEQIADILHLSRQTVRNKVFRLMEDVGVHNRTLLSLAFHRCHVAWRPNESW